MLGIRGSPTNIAGNGKKYWSLLMRKVLALSAWVRFPYHRANLERKHIHPVKNVSLYPLSTGRHL